MSSKFLKCFLVCCLVVGLLPSFSCLCSTKAFAQAATSLSDIKRDILSYSQSTQDTNDQISQQQDSPNHATSQAKTDQEEEKNSKDSYNYSASKLSTQDFSQTAPIQAEQNLENSEASNMDNRFNVELVDYEITITTQDISNAGFDGLVQVRVNGVNGSTNFHFLDSSANDFERAKSNSYVFRDRSVGAVKSLDIETDSKQNWFLQHAFLKVLGQTYFFWANYGWVNGDINIPVFEQRVYDLDWHTLDYPNAGSHYNCFVNIVGDKGFTGYYNLKDPTRNGTGKITFVSRDVGKINNVIVANDYDSKLYEASFNVFVASSVSLITQFVIEAISRLYLKSIAKNKNLEAGHELDDGVRANPENKQINKSENANKIEYDGDNSRRDIDLDSLESKAAYDKNEINNMSSKARPTRQPAQIFQRDERSLYNNLNFGENGPRDLEEVYNKYDFAKIENDANAIQTKCEGKSCITHEI